MGRHIYSVSGHFPLDKCSHRTIAPHEIRPEQLPSGLLPPGQSPLNSFTLDNCPHEIYPRAIAPWTFAPRTFSQNNSPLNTRIMFSHLAVVLLLMTLGLMNITQHNHKRFQSRNSFASKVFRWNTQLFLFEKNDRVNSLVNLPCSEVGLRNEHSHFQMYACLHSFKFCENLSCH